MRRSLAGRHDSVVTIGVLLDITYTTGSDHHGLHTRLVPSSVDGRCLAFVRLARGDAKRLQDNGIKSINRNYEIIF